jgi:hypothetical protein
MLDLPDPITGVIGLFFKRAIESKIWQRLELLLELGLASSISFLLACGLSLMTKQPAAWAIGSGMVAAALALFATFQASSNSRGLVISVQSQVAQQKLDTPMTTIQRK